MIDSCVLCNVLSVLYYVLYIQLVQLVLFAHLQLDSQID